MIRLSLAGAEMLVLNKLEDIDEILVKRSGNYSSRKQLIYAGKYRSGDKVLSRHRARLRDALFLIRRTASRAPSLRPAAEEAARSVLPDAEREE